MPAKRNIRARKPAARKAPRPKLEEAAQWVGKPLPRKEEGRLVRGKGKFVDDYELPGMLHLWLVRSPYGHARVTHIDVSQAEAQPGVVCTLTGPEVAKLVRPFLEIGPEPGAKIVDYPMGVDKVRYQGEPVAAVVAETALAAADAAELVRVDYEPLPAVVDPEDALRDATLLHESAGTNVVWQGEFDYGDVDKAFQQAAHIVHIDRLHFHRFTSAPLEPNAVIAQWDPGEDFITFWCNNSFPAFAIQFLALALGIRIDQMRVQTYDIGGSFGIKITNYPYMALCALASRKAGGRPVKWIETRTDHMTASAHGNERVFRSTRVALDTSGRILAIESRHIDDCGAYPRYEPLGCIIWAQVLPGAYRFRNYRVRFTQVTTNKCPVGPNRGYSRMQHLWFLERVVDICAHALGIPADEMRRRNYIRADEFPYTTPNGCVYDSGDYARMLALAQERIGWDDWKEKQRRARAEGRLVGIGIGTTLDSGTNNFGQSRLLNPNAPFSGQSGVAIVKLGIDGNISVSLGSVPQGQGHETTSAQVVADVLNVTPELVSVRPGFDTERNAHTGHSGTYASQFAVTGLSAAHGAAQKLKAEMKRLAVFALNAKEDKLEFGMGAQGPEVRVRGSDKAIPYWGLANLVNVNNAVLPAKLQDVTLNCRYVYRPPFRLPDLKRKYGNLTLTYSAQLHIAVIEVDRDTYVPRILDYAVVDDCGRVVNPLIVEGQVHGATAHGIGAALLETCSYDENGNLRNATFSDYVPITSVNMPTLRTGHLESPSPFTFNGAKGMGEGGGAPLHAISAALQDALYAQGVIIDDSHNNASSLFHLLERTRAGRAAQIVRVESRAAAARR
ncbi:MAG: xanthine dehydrogenase family protein [Acidobacteria bacterium]|nr:xanthine dehydrogenase family protein [Acidobacteriota bacterium]